VVSYLEEIAIRLNLGDLKDKIAFRVGDVASEITDYATKKTPRL